MKGIRSGGGEGYAEGESLHDFFHFTLFFLFEKHHEIIFQKKEDFSL